MKLYCALILLFSSIFCSWAAGGKEAQEVSPARAKYLAERGQIIPYQEVQIDSLIGAIDYAYPDPENEFGVEVYTGHRQVTANGQSELVLIGVQGRRYRWQDLPPLNLVLVVDKSGSMRQPNKMDWVRDSAAILLNTIRGSDYLSLVAFDSQARVLVPSSPMNEIGIRGRLQTEIKALEASGDSNIVEGLAAGFREAMVHFSVEKTNRVLLLTDGWGVAKGIGKMVKKYRNRGIEVSVIGYGESFDTRFAEDLHKIGGGSTRFISDQARMDEVFGKGLARTAVPLARDIHIEVKLKEGNVRAAWGLNPVITYGDSGMIRFEVPAIHSGDYETAMVELKLPEKSKAGKRPVLTVRTRYKDLRGIVHELNPVGVTLEFVTASNPIAGFSDARVLKSGTMLHYALELQRISGTYQQYSDVYQAFFRSFEMKKELRNAATRLGDNSFADEIGVLENYMRITGKEIGFKKAVVEQIIADDELIPPEMDRPLKEHLDYLFRELVSRLSEAPPGTLAVSGFSVPGKDRVPFAEVVNEAGAVYLKTFLGSEYPVLERRKLDEILREQELALSDLGEPNQAIRIGKFLAANYLVTGTIIPMSESVVIFGRILNVETAVIEAVAQVIVPCSDEISSLL